MVLTRRALALLGALTCGSFSPLQGEGRGFETLSAHQEAQLMTLWTSVREAYALGGAVGDPGFRPRPPSTVLRCPHVWP